MALNTQIQTLLGTMRPQIPPPVFTKLLAVLDRLESTRVGAAAPKAGMAIPDVAVTGAKGERVSLRSLSGDGPLVLLFYRGGWCVFCDLTLRAFDRALDDITAAGGRLIAVSPQTVENSEKTGQERQLRFDLFSDPRNEAAQAFGLTWQLTPEERELYVAFNADLAQANGNQDWELPAPAAFLIDRQGMIRWSWVDSNYTRRPEPAEVVAELRKLA